MPPSLREFISSIGIIDVHEHHIPEILLNREVNLLQLFRQSYAGWAQARPYPLPSETRDSDPMLAAAGPTTWEALAPFLENSGSNSFVRNLVRAVTELYTPANLMATILHTLLDPGKVRLLPGLGRVGNIINDGEPIPGLV